MHQRRMDDVIYDRRPLTMAPDAMVAAACAAMHLRRVDTVLVAETEDCLASIVTGRGAARCFAEGCDATRSPLPGVVIAGPVTLTPEPHASDALQPFDAGGVWHLPVCRDGGVLDIDSYYHPGGAAAQRLDEETGFFGVPR